MNGTKTDRTTAEREALIIERMKPGCICKGIRRGHVMDAIKDGARSFKEVAARTGIGSGPCKAERCARLVKGLLEKKG